MQGAPAGNSAVVDLRSYLAALRARWWIAAVACLAAAGLAAAVAYSATPQYRATIKLVAAETAGPAGATSPLSSAQRLATYEALLATTRLAEAVTTRLALDATPEELLGRIHVTAVPQTVVLTVAVDDSDPRRARDIAAAVGEEFPGLLATLGGPVGGGRGSDELTVFEPALLPGEPASPRPLRMVLVGAALGLLAGLLTVAAGARGHQHTSSAPDTSPQSAQVPGR